MEGIAEAPQAEVKSPVVEDVALCADLYPKLLTEEVEEEDVVEDVNGATRWMESLSLLEENLDSALHENMAEQEQKKKPEEKVVVSFSVVKKIAYGADVFIAGSSPELGSWELTDRKGHRLQWTDGDMWHKDFELVFREKPFVFEYKYYISSVSKHNKGKNEDFTRWEDGLNHVVMITGEKPTEHVKLNDQWGSSGASKFNGDQIERITRTKSQDMKPFVDKHLKPFQINTVVFRVRAQTEYGDVMCICGSLPQLGGWQRTEAIKMKYKKPGEDKGYSLWECSVSLPSDRVQFEYKYFITRANGTRLWETGYENSPANRSAMTWMLKETEKGKVVLEDKFECNVINFSIFYPVEKDEIMHVTGEPAEIGKWFDPGPVPMNLGEKEKLETDVEGQKWELSVFLPRSTKQFQYRYVLKNMKTEYSKWEREPNRVANLTEMNPVNSIYALRDVNFVADMQFHACPPDMVIGPYPQTAGDIDDMAKAGVTAVLNVQTDEDFEHRQIDWDTLKKHYDKVGIDVVRYEIRDFDRDSLRVRLMGAVRVLDKFHMDKKVSYIHCTAGMGRAPAVVVAYLVWVKKWKLNDAVAHVKHHRPVAVPNVPVLEDALRANYTLY